MEDVLSGFVVFALTVPIALQVGRRVGVESSRIMLLLVWHTAFCLVYWQHALSNLADANAYYTYGERGDITFAVGTAFVRSLCVVLVRDLGLSFLGAMMVFNGVGTVGILFLAATLDELATPLNPLARRWALFIPFLPLLSFWSCSIGKDAIAFLGVCMASRATTQIDRRWVGLVVGIAIVFLVRPHVAAFMLSATGFALVMGRGVPLSVRIVGIGASLTVAAWVLPFVQSYVGLGQDDLVSFDGYQDALVDYVEKRQGYNLEGGSSVDISQLSVPLQLFTFMFRPLFIDAPGLFGLEVSIENLLLLAMFAAAVAKLPVAWARPDGFFVRFSLAHVVLGWLALGMTVANMGLAVRQKTMLLPAAFCVFLASRSASATPTNFSLPNATNDLEGERESPR